jgi:hypothetical protein
MIPPPFEPFHVCVHRSQYWQAWYALKATSRADAMQEGAVIAQQHRPHRVTLHADPESQPIHTWNLTR